MGSGLCRVLQDTGVIVAVHAWPSPVGSGPQGPDCSRCDTTPTQISVAFRRWSRSGCPQGGAKPSCFSLCSCRAHHMCHVGTRLLSMQHLCT